MSKNEYHLKKKKEYDAQKKAVLSLIKVMRGCSECGFRGHPQALQFDHIDPSTKEHPIANYGQISWPKLLAETLKCRVLCANCHSVHTAQQQENNVVATAVSDKTKNLINETLQCDLLTSNFIPAWQSFAITMPTANPLTIQCNADSTLSMQD